MLKKVDLAAEMGALFDQQSKILADRIAECSKLCIAAGEKITQNNQAFTKELSETLEPLSRRIAQKSAAMEQRAPFMKKTWFATFTTPYRMVVDFVLRYV